MSSEDFTIPVGKYDFIWATHDRAPGKDSDDSAPTLAVMIHGFPGDRKSYGDIFGALVPVALKRGMHTVRFDMRGCGQSDKAAQFFSLQTAHEDLSAVLHWAEKTGYARFILIAEGFGAAVALSALSDAMRPKIAGLVLLWPIIDPKESWLGDNLPEIGPALRGDIAGFDFSALARRITMPVLVQHGTEDEKAPPVQLDALSRNARPGTIEAIRYTGGAYGLKDPALRALVLRNTYDFLKKTTATAQ